MKKEYWKDIPGFEGLYQGSTLGRIMNSRTGRILRPGNACGYLRVVLRKDGENCNKLVHILIAETFLPNPENKPCIDHIDGNRHNNCVSNLRWCTYKENQNNPITRKRISEGRKKPVICYNNYGIIKVYISIRDTEKDGFKYKNVCSCCKGKRQFHHGCQFRYATEEDITDITKKHDK